ncbi:hypothetical protein [Sphingomonas japonica]|uniref:Uncharacterized protein n=1 Tax=Sphingomonas japonica TaxID=511662 RepID=A0ABX0U3B3_9SPHN|nr:hypothetical protein [Sphingomonas japonica]NIJ23223.1 hypothetical protein [Sphingomonas japonica]
MLNIVSILIGIFALPFIVIGSIPFLALTLWFVIFIPIVGAAVGALSSSNSGRNFNLILIVATALRLFIGGGII